MKRCVNGMFAEIKFLKYFLWIDLQAVQISHLEKFIPQAFPEGIDLIIDAEVLLVDNATGKPLPFGTLGIHKKDQFKDASVCLFVFDILRYNDDDLMARTLMERKRLLESQMKVVENRVVMSNYQLIRNGDHAKLKTMIWKAIDEGLEGLVLKDTKSIYEPGKRHWLKVKKDYLEEGKMADTADLIVLGAYFGTGSKGGMMSVFLMGVYDQETKSYRTVTKCGNGHTDEALEAINKKLKDKMTRIDRDFDRLPKWLRCSRSLAPDFVINDPKEAPVWEITGKFPRVTRIRKDKDWQSATNLKELKNLYECSKTVSDVDRSFEDETPLYAKEGMDHCGVEELIEVKQKCVDIAKAGDGSLGLEVKKEREEDIAIGSSDSRGKKRKARDDSPTVPVKKERSDSAGDNNQCPPGMTPCKYGAECYRKNKDHKAEFWHPKK
ncbi:unnamed protein product [Nippostrongylus brasiliensis]|uniref:DNA ligase 3 (inferred by orthology to a human protein) n=1 Tax=Nippostrongylus brasiliensis TaxID=27835 RepID=A0A0N4Y262_NIPBR|nr:unnamed protein product [Nippostrongylus brasiliensis]